MNRDLASDLATKINEVWGGRGPAVVAWVEEFAELDYDLARQTLNGLRRTADNCPSIARFHAAYNEVRKANGKEHPPCLTCDGVGWLEAPAIEHLGHVYSQVDRCIVCGGSGKSLGGSR